MIPGKYIINHCASYFRGMYRSLWVGALIAAPSGAGVALSLLGGNAAGLVGVAISASLLPPAVNAVSNKIRNLYCVYDKYIVYES